LAAGEAKNVGYTVVLARLFNEASGQKAPSKNGTLLFFHPLETLRAAKNSQKATNG
jgi:hypothetical protein